MRYDWISVVICCHNAQERIAETLYHLSIQSITTNIKWEILLVDNGSTDQTINVVLNATKVLDLPDFKILSQPIAGKTFALDLGVKSANYDLIVICDDDNWLDRNYIYCVSNLFNKLDNIGAFGGYGIPISNIELPKWFSEYTSTYAVGAQARISGESANYLWGAGLVFLKEIYMKAYTNFPPLLTGPKDGIWSTGEDTEFTYRILLMGYELVYSEALIFQHFITDTKLTISYRDRLITNFESENAVLNYYARQIEIKRKNGLKLFCLLMTICARLVLSFLKISQRWNIRYELETLFFISGLQFMKIEDSAIKIHHFYARHK